MNKQQQKKIRASAVLITTHIAALLAGGASVIGWQRTHVPEKPASIGYVIPYYGNNDGNHDPLNHDNCLVTFNTARLQNGLHQALNDGFLQNYAQKHAEDIASGKTSGHAEFDAWVNSGKFSGMGYAYVAELIEDGNQNTTCPSAVNDLLSSPTHRNGLLSPNVKSVGVGTAGNEVVYIISLTAAP